MKNISILGSTGSIGTTCLDIVRMHPDKFKIKALTAANNIQKFSLQIDEFKPEIVAVSNKDKAMQLSKLLTSSCKPEILFGQKGYVAAASYQKSDIVLLAIVGSAGLDPALAAIEARKKIALANKETLVMAGQIVMAKASENQVSILPVDSEHSAIYQCLKGNNKKDLKKIFLTGSGGPFLDKPFKDFKNITIKEALKHPTWNMGDKITIDSATLMNKALEVIEAVHLFDIKHDMIKVLIHPQSIVHSMVGYKDGSIIAQIGIPDMKSAVGYALSEPERLDLKVDFPKFTTNNSMDTLDSNDIKANLLSFENPDTKKFPSLLFAYEACRQQKTLPAVMNAANEEAVKAFLLKKISFLDIFRLIEKTMEKHTIINDPDLSNIIEADLWAREKVLSLV